MLIYMHTVAISMFCAHVDLGGDVALAFQQRVVTIAAIDESSVISDAHSAPLHELQFIAVHFLHLRQQ